MSSNAGGFGAAGTCQRVRGLFTKLTFATYGGATLQSTSVFSLQTPSVLITPPLLTTETHPIYSVTQSCPVLPGVTDLNWLFVQWTETERRALSNSYLFGTATYSTAGGIVISGQYDIDGATYFPGAYPMQGSCANGVYTVSGGSEDARGSVYFNAAGMGVFKTSGGRATFFFPRATVVAATHFGGKTFRGIVFDSDSANGVGDVRHIKGSANGAGTTFTIQPLSDPENDVVDVGGSTFTDTVTFLPGNINAPAAGMLYGTVTRTGAGAGTGRVGCIANPTDGDVMLLCSGESPSNNLVPFHFSLYAVNVFNDADGFDAYVIASVRDSAGRLYVAGNFDSYGVHSRPRIARMASDGTLDTTFDPGTGFAGSVYALAYDPLLDKIYAGGSFTSFNGTAVSNIARLNLDGTRDTDFTPGSGFSGGDVSAILVDGSSRVYAGGGFTTFNGTGRNRIARLTSAGALDTGFAPGAGFDGSVSELAFDPGGKIYAGGNFTTYAGTGRTRFARILTTGALDTTFATGGGGFDNWVSAIAVLSTGALYVGGQFTTAYGTGRVRVARLTSTGAVDTAFNPGAGVTGGNVSTAILDGTSGNVYFGGTFTTYNGSSRNGIVRVTSTGAVDTGFNPGTGATVTAIGLIDRNAATGVLTLGGDFTIFNGTGRVRLARVSDTGVLDTSYGVSHGGFNSAIVSLVREPSSGDFYVGGHFTYLDATARGRIARLNADGTLDTAFDSTSGFDNGVRSIVIGASGKVYAGGSFTTFAGTSRAGIARLNADGSLDTTFDPGSGFSPADVLSLQWDAAGQKLYVGGNFTTFNGTSRVRVARLNADGSLDTTFDPGTGFNIGVNAVAFDGTTGMLYVGGGFTTYNGAGASRLVRLDANAARDTTFNQGGSGFDSAVWSIALDPTSGKLYVGGNYDFYNGVSRGSFTRLNADGSLDTTFNFSAAGFNGDIAAIAPIGDTGSVYASGSFNVVNGAPPRCLARLKNDGSVDTTFLVGVNLNGCPSALLYDSASAKLIAGGTFTRYGNVKTPYLLRVGYTGEID